MLLCPQRYSKIVPTAEGGVCCRRGCRVGPQGVVKVTRSRHEV